MNTTFAPSYAKINNFGDKLNLLLANEVFSTFLGSALTIDSKSASNQLLAIGSYLSSEMLDACGEKSKVVVLGMGTGYADFPIRQCFGLGRKFPVTVSNNLKLPLPINRSGRSENFRIYWVRGPLSAHLLGLDSSLSICDAAYQLRFARSYGNYKLVERDRISFMPHYTAATSSVGLRALCTDLGIHYIDPTSSVEEVLCSISRSKVLMTEALHGAIVSDSLRVPWIPLKSSEDVFEFKWLDFCASIGVEYDPAQLRVRWDRRCYSGRSPTSIFKYVTTRTRSALSRVMLSEKDTAYDLLRASTRRPIMSGDRLIQEFDAKLLEKLTEFSEDVRSGLVYS